MNVDNSILRCGRLMAAARLMVLLGLAGLTPPAPIHACTPPPTYPPPDTVTAEPLSNEVMSVHWRVVPGVLFYRVYRKGADGEENVIVDAWGDQSYGFNDGPGLNGATKYTYYVKSFNYDYNTGIYYESEPSMSASAFTYPDPPNPEPVQTLSNTSLKIQWPAVAGAEFYEVYRNTSPQTSETFAMVGLSPKPSFEDAVGLKEATRYYYKIRSRGPTGISPYCQPVMGWTAPNPPTGLQVKADVTSASCMTVTWVDRSLKEKGFILERSATGGEPWRSFILDAPSPGSGQTVKFRDNQGIEEGKQYWYRVRATFD